MAHDDSAYKYTLNSEQNHRLHSILNPQLFYLNKIFTEHCFQLRLVGGVVRDICLNKCPGDVDLATNATPAQVSDLFKSENVRFYETGLQHGTITALVSKQTYEITSLRTDIACDGRHAVVEFTENWRLDAERRDLTINAMSLSFDGYLYDYFNGREHLKLGIIRFVGSPMRRICEDYLRILRYFRFHGRVSLTDDYDEDIINAIEHLKNGLRTISGERIWNELQKILTGPRNVNIMKCMFDCGVCECIQLVNRNRLTSLATVSIFSSNPVSLLVSLLETSEDFLCVHRRWNLSNNEKNLGLFILQHRDAFKDFLFEEKNKLSRRRFKYATDLLVDKVKLLFVHELLLYWGDPESAQVLIDFEIPDFPVSGNDVIACGIPRGKLVGATLQKLRTYWKESFYSFTKKELLKKIAAESNDNNINK
ncbi:CCA tRNA nucleotidyltransferase 1, mitochondrial-like [Zophobas morio]|uniref:CCA tRNA nucleotidyltransferase 1, mitochondrial-like n=1 Tax=Zophobas morio TaxID=2755281 RepID=UPI0030832620